MLRYLDKKQHSEKLFTVCGVFLLHFKIPWPVNIFSGQQSQIDFLLGIDNDIPKVILNLQ